MSPLWAESCVTLYTLQVVFQSWANNERPPLHLRLVFFLLLLLILPKPQKYVKQWPLGLLLWVYGIYFTYLGGLGRALKNRM